SPKNLLHSVFGAEKFAQTGEGPAMRGRADAGGPADAGVGLTGGGPDSAEPGHHRHCCYRAERISRMSSAASDGVLPTLTPAASRASFFACAVPAEPETMAPAWPMVLPSGAVKPAT